MMDGRTDGWIMCSFKTFVDPSAQQKQRVSGFSAHPPSSRARTSYSTGNTLSHRGGGGGGSGGGGGGGGNIRTMKSIQPVNAPSGGG
mmetsp:Transcript_11345/g.30004  ORF Transcript_11345/g.30004 Transcript_11345/m.30004 type:complete len:87 (-) Transcript_11345:573-833(-)